MLVMKNFNVFGHQVGDAYRGVVSMFSSVSKESKFDSSGTLTPEEFVEAGDQLVYRFPTWQWAPASKGLEKSYLPKDKQYLVTRGVPCLTRVRDLDHVLATTSHMDNEDGWLVAGVSEAPPDAPPEMGVLTSPIPLKKPLSEFADLDRELLEEDPRDNITRAPVVVETEHRIRSYDLSITWDKYYQTPRLWLFGYDSDGHPLPEELVYQDVLSEYVTKTVTVDAHPATGFRTASIHPCQHARMMLKVINEWKTSGHPVRPDLSLFVFLKFISGVVPTINYDFTMDIDM